MYIINRLPVLSLANFYYLLITISMRQSEPAVLVAQRYMWKKKINTNYKVFYDLISATEVRTDAQQELSDTFTKCSI